MLRKLLTAFTIALTALIAEPKFVADAAKTGRAAEKEHKQLKECIAIIKVRQ